MTSKPLSKLEDTVDATASVGLVNPPVKKMVDQIAHVTTSARKHTPYLYKTTPYNNLEPFGSIIHYVISAEINPPLWETLKPFQRAMINNQLHYQYPNSRVIFSEKILT